MAKAEQAMERKDTKTALALYREIMQTEPDYAPAYFLAARVHRLKKENDQSLAMLEKALQIQPDFGQALAESIDLLNSWPTRKAPKSAGQGFGLLHAGRGLARPGKFP